MKSLPKTNDFLDFRSKLLEKKNFSNSSQNNYSFSLSNSYRLYRNSLDKQREKVLSFNTLELSETIVNPTQLLYELINIHFLRTLKNSNKMKLLNKYIGYSKKYNSLTISILDDKNEVQCIAIRSAKDRTGKDVKWKTYGSKKYISSRINDSTVFLAVGMAEYILLELLGVSYIHLQSDGMYKHISEKLIDQVHGCNIIVFKENDKSFEKLINNLYIVFSQSNIFVIDFEKLLNKELKKGYDLRDFINEIKDLAEIEKILDEELLSQLNRGSIL